MAEVAGESWPWLGQGRQAGSAASEQTPGGSRSTPWVVVAANVDPGEAAIIRGRLESEDIPSVVQQEAMGPLLGLTVGPLGSAKVLVPEPLAERAMAILAETFDDEGDEDEAGETDQE